MWSKTISAASTNLTQVKGGSGRIVGLFASNINAAARYLKFYDALSASVIVGTTVPTLTLMIPGGSTAGSGFFLNLPCDLDFSTGISFALTTGVADNDTGAVGASDIVVTVLYG